MVKINIKKQKLKKIPILSFFTGGGFLDIGFEQAGFDVVWTNECNNYFAELYKNGYNSWYKSLNSTKITKITDDAPIETLKYKKILNQAFLNDLPEIFGIIGGPPCPDFSTGGKHKGEDGERGKLTRTYVELIIKMQPSFFVLENVSGLHKFHKHRLFLDKMENLLREKGHYVIDHRILNALEYGVPQNRERIFIVGINRDFAKKYYNHKHVKNLKDWYPWPNIPKYSNALKRFKWPIPNAYGDIPERPVNIPDELMVNKYMLDKDDQYKIPNGNDVFKAHSKKFYSIKEGDTSRKSFKRLHRYKFSPTACYGNNEVHLHPWLPRRLSIREAMRLQGIPDSYILPENTTLSSKFKMISNGVPVPLAYNVAKSLRKYLTHISKSSYSKSFKDKSKNKLNVNIQNVTKINHDFKSVSKKVHKKILINKVFSDNH